MTAAVTPINKDLILPPTFGGLYTDNTFNGQSVVEKINSLVTPKEQKKKFNITEIGLILADLRSKPWHLEIPIKDIISFFYTACKSGANPLEKDIYLIPFKDKRDQGRPKANAIFSVHFFNRVAERTKEVHSIYTWSEVVVEKRAGGTERDVLIGHASVRRVTTDREYKANVYFDEVAKKNYDGKYTKFWSAMPRTMVEKCALAKCLRLTFPNVLGGYYTLEEMGEAFKGSEDWSQAMEEEFKKGDVPLKQDPSTSGDTQEDAPPVPPAPVSLNANNKAALAGILKDLGDRKIIDYNQAVNIIKNLNIDDSKALEMLTQFNVKDYSSLEGALIKSETKEEIDTADIPF